MSTVYAEKCPTISFETLDVLNLGEQEEGVYDCVIDKGMFDTILCGFGSGPNSDIMLRGILHVLNSQGVYICISYGTPEEREHYFRNSAYDWDLTTHRIAKPYVKTTDLVETEDKEAENFHYIYVMRKSGAPKHEQY